MRGGGGGGGEGGGGGNFGEFTISQNIKLAQFFYALSSYMEVLAITRFKICQCILMAGSTN